MNPIWVLPVIAGLFVLVCVGVVVWVQLCEMIRIMRS